MINPTMLTLISSLSLLIAAYLLGSLSFAIIISYFLRAPDPREYGSGNPGTTNMLRGGRSRAAFLTLLGDSAKGWIAIILPIWCQGSVWVIAGCAITVFLGHLYPIFFHFKGGKGVATGLGVLLALAPLLALSALVIWLFVMLTSRIASLSAIIAAMILPILAFLLWGLNHPYFWAIMLMLGLTLYRHRLNIVDLLAQREMPIHQQPSNKK